MSISVADVRVEVPDFDPLSWSDWYKALPPSKRAEVGAWKYASSLKTGWHFENLMQQSLLHRALYLGPGQPEFRYLHHEIIEESQHTLMFNELVERLGVPAKGSPWLLRRVGELLNPVLAKHYSAAFFILVLCGEEPVDYYQRQALAEGIAHPLVASIMRIHVAEEARHVSFARISLEREVAGTGWVGRQLLGIHAACSFALMSRVMLRPPAEMARSLGVPRHVLTRPYRTPAGRAFAQAAVARPRTLLEELGILTGPAAAVWRALGLGRCRGAGA